MLHDHGISGHVLLISGHVFLISGHVGPRRGTIQGALDESSLVKETEMLKSLTTFQGDDAKNKRFKWGFYHLIHRPIFRKKVGEYPNIKKSFANIKRVLFIVFMLPGSNMRL